LHAPQIAVESIGEQADVTGLTPKSSTLGVGRSRCWAFTAGAANCEKRTLEYRTALSAPPGPGYAGIVEFENVLEFTALRHRLSSIMACLVG